MKICFTANVFAEGRSLSRISVKTPLSCIRYLRDICKLEGFENDPVDPEVGYMRECTN